MPARMLNAFLDCQRLFYYEFVEGVFVESADALRRGAIHQRVPLAGKPEAPIPTHPVRVFIGDRTPQVGRLTEAAGWARQGWSEIAAKPGGVCVAHVGAARGCRGAGATPHQIKARLPFCVI